MPPAIPVSTESPPKLTFAAGPVWMRDKILDVWATCHLRAHTYAYTLRRTVSVVHKCVTYMYLRGTSSVYCIDQMLLAGVADTHMYLRRWYMVRIAIYFANVRYSHV